VNAFALILFFFASSSAAIDFFHAQCMPEVVLMSSHALERVIPCRSIRRATVRMIDAFSWIVYLFCLGFGASALFVGSPTPSLSSLLSEVMMDCSIGVENQEK
jgi:hypothetical protein